MSKYKFGDPVQVIDRTDGEYLKTGVVVAPDDEATSALVICFGEYNKTYLRGQIEPVPEIATHPVQYPADGHPEHYTAGLPTGVAAVDVIKAHLEAGGTWDTANALKYILRHHAKENPTQDIKKAIRCLNMWVAEQEAA